MSQPQVVFGAGHVHITQIKDALGNAVTPPQVIAAPAVQNISADFGKADVKLMYGQKEFALHAAQGKKSTEVSFECGELHANMLNALYFGQSLTAGSNIIYRDMSGTAMPDSYTKSYKVNSKRIINLAGFAADSSTSTLVSVDNTTVMEKITDATATLATNQYRVTAAGVYTFAQADKNKVVFLRYTVKTPAGNKAGVAKFKIPNISPFSIKVSKFTKVTFSN